MAVTATAAAVKCVANGDRCFAIEWRFFEHFEMSGGFSNVYRGKSALFRLIIRRSFINARFAATRFGNHAGKCSEGASKYGDHADKCAFYRHSF